MIGKRMADLLLEGHTLAFYQWDRASSTIADVMRSSGEGVAGPGSSGADGVKVLLQAVVKNIDLMAESWSVDERRACLEETGACFQFGGALMSYISPPRQAPSG